MSALDRTATSATQGLKGLVCAHTTEVAGLITLMTYLKTTLAPLCERLGSIIEKVSHDETHR
jgi:hypothetical protein